MQSTKNKTTIPDYCKHGDAVMWSVSFKAMLLKYGNDIYTKKFLLCKYCLDEASLNDNLIYDYDILIKDLLSIKKPGKELIYATHPELYAGICSFTKHLHINNWFLSVYMFKNNLRTLPVCKYCGQDIQIVYTKDVVPQFCPGKCKSNFLKESGHYTRILHDHHEKVNTELYENRYAALNYKVTLQGSNASVHDYCQHGNVVIKKWNLNKLYELHSDNLNEKKYLLCDQCKESYIDQFENLNYDEQLKLLNSLNTKGSNEKIIYRIYPELFKAITQFSKKYDDLIWSEKVFLFKHNLSTKNKCSHKDCNEEVNFCYSKTNYNMYCEKHLNSITVSSQENIIFKWVRTHFPDAKQSYRTLGKELDIFIPSKKIGIEFNGLYWHNEFNRTKDEHFKKWKLCNENNISLLYIWEDDWNLKQNIIKSIIKAKLGLLDIKIYARKCTIKNVSNDDKTTFLNENHLQGACPSSINLGLYYNEELVSLMTFGKKRMVLRSKSASLKDYELLRFCNKLETSVVGGASKLLTHFIKIYEPGTILSYASCDISDGSFYETLGFISKGHTGLNYWWYKNNLKQHRSNFMKHKLVKAGYDINKTEDEIMRDRGFVKIWGTGNMKYERTFPKNII